MLYNQKSDLYHLLGNKILIQLSYNQIINCADYFILDKSLHYILLNQLRTSIERETYFADVFIKKKKYQSNFKTLIVVKQLIANILNKFFEDSFLINPFNFHVLKTNIKIEHKLDKVLKHTNYSLQLTNFNIVSNIAFKHILKTISYKILDKKFYNFLNKFFLIKKNINLKNLFLDRSCKFYRIICNIYLLQLDNVIIKFFKQNNCNFIFKNKQNMLSATENMVYKSICFIKKDFCNVSFKDFLSKKIDIKTNLVCYIRYFNEIFFAIDNLFRIMQNFRNTIIFFCKSTLLLNFKIIGWSHLKKTIIKFSGIYYKVKQINLNNVFIQAFFYIGLVKMQFVNFEIINKKTYKPIAISYLLILYNNMILNWYNYLLLSLKNYYSKIINYKNMLNTLFYFLKWSLLNTLKKKHKKSFRKILFNFYKINSFSTVLKKLPINLNYVYQYYL